MPDSKLVFRNFLLLNLLLLITAWIWGTMEAHGDTNAAGMYLLVTRPYWLLFNCLYLVTLGFALQYTRTRLRLMLLFAVAFVCLTCLIILQSAQVPLLATWLAMITLNGWWVLSRNTGNKSAQS